MPGQSGTTARRQEYDAEHEAEAVRDRRIVVPTGQRRNLAGGRFVVEPVRRVGSQEFREGLAQDDFGYYFSCNWRQQYPIAVVSCREDQISDIRGLGWSQ